MVTQKLGAVALALLLTGGAQAQPLPELRAAAERGDAVAEFHLAQRYQSGEGLKADPVKSFCWAHRSAEHGYISAWLDVGIDYGMGTGVGKDNIESYKWFYLITLLAPPQWPDEIKQDAREDAAGIGRQMSAADIAQAKARAQAWWAAVKARGPLGPQQQYVPFPGDRPAC
jgi:TPR repeat protein